MCLLVEEELPGSLLEPVWTIGHLQWRDNLEDVPGKPYAAMNGGAEMRRVFGAGVK